MQRIGKQFVWAAVLTLATTVISVPTMVAGTRGGHNVEDRNRDRNRDRDRDRDRNRGRKESRDTRANATDDRGRDLRKDDRGHDRQVDNHGRDRQRDDHGRGRRHDL